MKAGDRVLLPAVGSAAKHALVLADGFSCRTQIAQATTRRALHLADVLEMASREGVRGPAGDYPERGYIPEYGGAASSQTAVAVASAALGVGAVGYVLLKRRR